MAGGKLRYAVEVLRIPSSAKHQPTAAVWRHVVCPNVQPDNQATEKVYKALSDLTFQIRGFALRVFDLVGAPPYNPADLLPVL